MRHRPLLASHWFLRVWCPSWYIFNMYFAITRAVIGRYAFAAFFFALAMAHVGIFAINERNYKKTKRLEITWR